MIPVWKASQPRSINLDTLFFLSHNNTSRRVIYIACTVRPINNTPRRPAVARRAESARPPEVTWERTTSSSLSNYQCCLWVRSRLRQCMRQTSRFRLRASHLFGQLQKQRSAWLPPRHRSITTPFICHGIGNFCNRQPNAASVQAQIWIGCWCQTLFEAIGKSFHWKFSSLSWMWIDWTEWPWVNFIQSATPSGRHKIAAYKGETPTTIHILPSRHWRCAWSAACHWSRSTLRWPWAACVVPAVSSPLS